MQALLRKLTVWTERRRNELIIACVGLYGTMAYSVARRTSEIGIRMALGASRLIESFLFDMQGNDPRALGVAVAILLSAALLAGYGPAWRASRIGPMIALRHE